MSKDILNLPDVPCNPLIGSKSKHALFPRMAHRGLSGPTVFEPLRINVQAQPSSFIARPECQIFVMWLILSPLNCIT
jgi:hypothetical protein